MLLPRTASGSSIRTDFARVEDYLRTLFAEVFRVLIDHYGILSVVAIGNENHGNTSSPGAG